MKKILSIRLFHFLIIGFIAFAGCAPMRAPIPTGTIPQAQRVTQEDDAYGREVLRQLSAQFPISNDRYSNDRVRTIVDRLAVAVDTRPEDWNVFVLNDPKMANAAATRGNYVFVWNGMLDAVPNDSELAAVISHEIGHVIAGHTKRSPNEEVREMATGLAGVAIGEYLGRAGGDPTGGLAQSLVTQVLQGFLVNPEAQRKEYEADEVGFFILDAARYNPQAAISFWQRANQDPRFASGLPQFFSTHPSSSNRLERLERLLPIVDEQRNSNVSSRQFNRPKTRTEYFR